MAKTIMITGASSGIGKSTKDYFAEKGWNVVATMRTPEKHSDKDNRENVIYTKLDVTEPDTISDSIQKAIDRFGSIDVLVNNAGYGAIGIFEKSSPETVRKQFEVNVFGLMDVMRQVLPYMRANRSGTIINVSSVAGRVTFPIWSLYHSTKWAVEGFTESVQHELRQFNIRMKLIEPGAIKTDFYDRSQDLINDREVPEYDQYEKRVYDNTQEFGRKAPGPIVVAKKIYQAATDNSNKLRYPVGSGAPYMIMLRKLLPESIFSSIVRKVLKG